MQLPAEGEARMNANATETKSRLSIFERLAHAESDDSKVTADHEGGQDLRLYDADTGEQVERVTAFRLSDGTFWVIDIDGMNADRDPPPQPDFERVRMPDEIWDMPRGDERTRRIKEWRARPEVQADQVRYEAWRERPEVQAAFDERERQFLARHTIEHRRPFYVEHIGTPGRRWYSR